MTAPVCSLQGVAKRYGRSPWILREASATFAREELVRVAGRNGAGKSTLLRIVAGVSRPTRGRVERPRGPVGYAADQLPTPMAITGDRYLRHMARVRGLDGRDAGTRVGELAEALELDDLLGLPVGDMSKGTAHKVALVQALLGGTALVVLDEPWSGLDASSRDRLSSLLLEERRRGTCIVVTDHEGDAGTADADREIDLRDGVLYARDPRTAAARTVEVTIEVVPAAGADTGPLVTAISALRAEATPEGHLLLTVPEAHGDDALRRCLDHGCHVVRVDPGSTR